ncbi:unnamed protein product [Bursaphelenchus okinawaensis]|uniref:Uncharacterized protein n=1 Tax=Bursaphelenchus okinawaensis TaxID=465554 RepID=A0A811K3D7_9BILA|nr:unnamed protein product [Bursaphelenchus okinawaensis]CAG9089760.1 unnamed protein product [Bursaphelenchus okinawaensis]
MKTGCVTDKNDKAVDVPLANKYHVLRKAKEIKEAVKENEENEVEELIITVFYSASGKLTYEVEVESNCHNNRFYELRNRTLNALHDILHNHSYADSIDFIVSSYDNAKERSKYHWKDGDVKLDMLIFARVECLRRLCLHMNGMLEVTISHPFQFRITELALFDVEMSIYSFTMLIRSICQSIQHLSLQNVTIKDDTKQCVPSSYHYLNELARIRSLESLRIDCDLNDIQNIIVHRLHKPLESLFLNSADLRKLHDLDDKVAKNIYVKHVEYNGNRYGVREERELQMAIEDWRRKEKVRSHGFKVIVGVPKSWSPSSHQTPIRQLAQIGRMTLCILVSDEQCPNDTLIETIMKMYI